MSRAELLCFDLDGCLVDSDAAIADALNHALAAIDLPPRAEAALRSSIGPPLVENLTRLMAEDGVDAAVGSGPDRLARGVAAYRARYAAVGYALTAPYPDIPATLDALADTPMVVVTAKPTAVATELVTLVGLADRFVAVHGTPGGLVLEEKRVTLSAVLAGRGVPPAAAVMIGDREHDVRAGRACGTGTVGVLWGAGTAAELTAAGAAALAAAPPDLPDVLAALARTAAGALGDDRGGASSEPDRPTT